jgi:[ribosomal protein S5]-alanine N-acetyltransferase
MRIQTSLSGCVLRPWRHDDKAALVSNANNRKIWRNLTEMFPHPYTEADAEHWLSIANQLEPSVHLAIEVEGSAVGGIGVIAGEGIARHTGQFGYWLGEARAMLAHVLAGSLFMRLEAPVFEWNPPSMRVLEKIGFVRESILKRSVFKDGELIDSVMFVFVRDV